MTDPDERVPHRCARNRRCADSEKHTERPEVCDACACHNAPGAPCTVPGGCGLEHHPEVEVWLGAYIDTAQGLCRMCAGRVEQAVNSLPLDVAELTMLMAPSQSVAQGAKVDGTRSLPVPMRVGIEALRAQIDDELQVWAEAIAEALGVDWSTAAHRRTRIGHRVQACARLIGPNIAQLAGLPPTDLPVWVDGEPLWDDEDDEFPPDLAGARGGRVQATAPRDGLSGALELLELHRRVEAVAGRRKLVHRLSAPCPWCSQRTLTRVNGASEVRCESDSCRGRAVPERFYDWLAAVVAAEEKRQKGRVA